MATGFLCSVPGHSTHQSSSALAESTSSPPVPESVKSLTLASYYWSGMETWWPCSTPA